MPPVPYVTLSDGIILMNLLACLGILLDTYVLTQKSGEWSDTSAMIFHKTIFAVTCGLFGIPFVILTVLCLLFYCRWQGMYDKKDE